MVDATAVGAAKVVYILLAILNLADLRCILTAWAACPSPGIDIVPLVYELPGLWILML